MDIPYSLLADLVAASHALMIALSFLGAIFTIKYGYRSIFINIFLLLWIIVTPIAQCIFKGCPITQLEKHLRALGNEEVYQGHFLEHYFNLSGDIVGVLFVITSILISIAILLTVRRNLRPESQEA